MHYIVLRTHGGLGNQLFQILFARLLTEKFGAQMSEVHDLGYRHAFPRSTLLSMSPTPCLWQTWICSLRLPKIAQRFFRRSEEPIWLGQTAYIDGYFQDVTGYQPFNEQAVGRQLELLANELHISPATIDSCLVHLRLGDFFSSRDGARDHALLRLKNVPLRSFVMTNDELMLQDPAVACLMEARELTLVSTHGMTAEQVLQTMTRYQVIDANDSTLTFWSSVLGGCRVTLRDSLLRNCRDHFVSCRNSLVAVN